MLYVAYVITNPSIRTCGNFGAFCVGGCVVRKAQPPCGATLPPFF